MDISIINPFEFLGLDINSSLNDLRKTYYKLSLLCHPDKGGDPEDMDTLHKCYLYVKEQLENINNTKKFEDFENEFKDFLKQQEHVKPPSFYEIFKDNPLNEEFNKSFQENMKKIINSNKDDDEDDIVNNNNNNIVNSFSQGGYGHLMENDDKIKEEEEDKLDLKNLNLNYNPNLKTINKPIKNIFKSEIIKYKDPIGINSDGNFMRLDMNSISDFSTSSSSDYMRAFSSNNMDEEECKKILENRPQSLEDLITLRENFDLNNTLINKKNNNLIN